MTQDEIRAILTIAIFAAYADSQKHDREREELRRIAEGLAQTPEINLPTLYQDVLLKRTSVEAAVAALSAEESRQLAYEMAVCVCDADGLMSTKEREFLQVLRGALQLDQVVAQNTNEEAEAISTAPLTGETAVAAAAGGFAAIGTATTTWGRVDDRSIAASEEDVKAPVATANRRPSTLDDAAINQKILRASVLNGAIELLPESLATMAIIPLQMRLVYQIGQSYGYQLDQGHIKDFLATIGVGVTSQYLEQAGRKLLGGLLGKKGKGLLGSLGKQAVSSGMSFAATYALGHVANQYYAGGRTISTQVLKDAYNRVLGEGRLLQANYAPAIEAQAKNLNVATVLSMVRGNTATF